jgi:hypothetical protein
LAAVPVERADVDRSRIAIIAEGCGSSFVARNIKCPVLVSAGERGWLKPERVQELFDLLKAEGRDVTLRMFTSAETAAAQAHADNPTLANEYIFDWVATRLGIAL